MTFHKRALKHHALVAALATAVFATSCGGQEPQVDTPQGTEHTEADVRFARMMIPHHEQAVQMSDLARSRAGAEVGALAERIRTAQGPEIERLEGFLEDWGAEDEHDVEHQDMEGMLSQEQMSDLAAAEGEDFDGMFLEYMVLHHEGAVDMARTELDEGVNGRARELAQEIIDAQEEEIEYMDDLLKGDGTEEPTEEDSEAGHGDH